MRRCPTSIVYPFACLAVLLVNAACAAVPVFINELHYDNASTDVGEAVEIAGPAGTDLSGWRLVLYNGAPASRAPYDTRVLQGSIPDLGDGYGVVVADYPSNGMQNGPDGIALVDAAGTVVQFLSYEGTFTAAGGPADGMTSVDIGVSEDGSTPVGESVQLSGSGATADAFAWTGPGTASFGALNTTQGFVAARRRVLINEVDADTAGTDALEFIELFDGGTGNTDLSGLVVVLYNGRSDTSYAAFDLDGFTTSADGYFVLGNSAVAGVDRVFADNRLQNGADAVALYEGDAADFPNGTPVVAATSLVDALVYASADADDAGLAVLLAAGQAQVDENGNNNKDHESMQRCPNGAGAGGETAAFALLAPTPGAANSCDDSATLTDIHAVQGSGAASPMAGATVTVEGVVTGDFQHGNGAHGDLNGFYVQAVNGDGDPSTSEGIFVFDGSTPATDVRPGDIVRVSGVVAEFFGETQLNVTVAGSVHVVSSGHALPAPAPIHLGSSIGVVHNADGDLIADLEAYEGMLVGFPQTLTVSESFNLDRFGELRLAEGGRFYQFTNDHEPDVAGYAAHLANLARRTLLLDDGLAIQNPDSIRYPAPGLSTAHALRMGDTVTGLMGNLRFSRGSGGSGAEAYRLMPTAEPLFVPGNPRPVASDVAGEVAGELRVASFNVLNFFNDLRAGGTCFPSGTAADCRGASNAQEYQRQVQKLVSALGQLEADIVALIELENDYPSGEHSAIAQLTAALNGTPTTCAGDYQYVAAPGGGRVGDDAIAVGLIYCGATVRIAPGTVAALLDDAALPALGLSGPIFNGVASSRSPLAVTFEQIDNAASFTVVVNHFKSKGPSVLDDAGSACGSDIDPAAEPDCDQGDGQGYWNARRTAAAQALSAWLATAPTGSADPDVLILGDLNAYPQEDPITELQARGYQDLSAAGGASAAPYSFVFDAQAGVLDYALANPSMAAQVAGLIHWHINADEADALDYNLDFGRNALIFDPSLPYRAADHDPVIVGLNLFNEIQGTSRRDVLRGTAGRDRILGGWGRDHITSGPGEDVLVYTHWRDGGDRISDFEIGADRINLAALLQGLGYRGTDPLADGYVQVARRGARVLVLLDRDGSAGRAPARPFLWLDGVAATALNQSRNFIF